MNRNLKTALVVCLLVLFPAVSYIYLKKGFEFQKNNFAELESKVKVNENSSLEFPYDSCLGKVNMVVFFNNKSNFSTNWKLIQGLEEQYTKIPKYLGVIYSSAEINPQDMDMQKIRWIQVPSDQWDDLRLTFPVDDFNFEDGSALILDINNQIRNTYNLSDPKGLKKIIEHASLLFPKQKRKR